MNKSEKLLSPDELKKRLSSEYWYFSNENHICVPVDLFEIIFTHKYGGFLSEWEVRIIDDAIHLKNISGFKYVFPLTKKPESATVSP